MLLKIQVAAAMSSGFGYIFNVTSVIIPSVPSLPIKSRVRSYPADDFLACVPVLIISPDAVTTVKAKTFSRMVP